MSGYELISSIGCGSAVIEMAFALACVPIEITEIPYGKPGPERDRLLSLNLLGQVPVLVLPDGEVLTESAAMMLHLDDLAPAAGLLPRQDDARRPQTLNRLLMLVAAIYPTVTFSDPPENWTLPGSPAERLGERLGKRKEELWRWLEGDITPTPFVHGERPGAIDLYVAVMTRWRPGSVWFRANTPKLAGVAKAVAEFPSVAPIIARHFPQ